MGLTAAILGALGGIAAVLGVLDILEVTSDRLIHDNLTWVFWMYAAIILILGAIACLLARKQSYPED
jgi:hypothetical protein